MRELTSEATAIAKSLGTVTHLRDTNGGFSWATVQLHLISAENTAGDPSDAIAIAIAIAIAAADALDLQALPTTERRALYFTDRAKAFAQWGRRGECIRTLLQAEYWAPQETHARPAVKSLVSGLLLSGRTTPELRGIAARTGVLLDQAEGLAGRPCPRGGERARRHGRPPRPGARSVDPFRRRHERACVAGPSSKLR
ncbi:hypothetical protein [Streptomyces goshikiensis]|uniref:hypothetical protein n=1 Tax=Streptomyces goshikiensis TaxID=1942 RepID=UPI0036911C00